MKSLGCRLAEGDQDAFAELYALCSDRMHHFLTVKLRSREDASDLLHDVFLKLVRLKRSFQEVENPMAYAFQVARNEAMRSVSRNIRKREQIRFAAANLFEPPASSEGSQMEVLELASQALMELSEEQLEIVVLKIYQGFTLKEIAEITETPPGTVATRYRRALEAMRERMGDQP